MNALAPAVGPILAKVSQSVLHVLRHLALQGLGNLQHGHMVLVPEVLRDRLGRQVLEASHLLVPHVDDDHVLLTNEAESRQKYFTE